MQLTGVGALPARSLEPFAGAQGMIRFTVVRQSCLSLIRIHGTKKTVIELLSDEVGRGRFGVSKALQQMQEAAGEVEEGAAAFGADQLILPTAACS